jgi:hypothetical protein
MVGSPSSFSSLTANLPPSTRPSADAPSIVLAFTALPRISSVLVATRRVVKLDCGIAPPPASTRPAPARISRRRHMVIDIAFLATGTNPLSAP